LRQTVRETQMLTFIFNQVLNPFEFDTIETQTASGSNPSINSSSYWFSFIAFSWLSFISLTNNPHSATFGVRIPL
jgi:hypothetical protein